MSDYNGRDYDFGMPSDDLDLDEFKELAGMDSENKKPEIKDLRGLDIDDTSDLLTDFKEFAKDYFADNSDETPAAKAEDFDQRELQDKLLAIERAQKAEEGLRTEERKIKKQKKVPEQDDVVSETAETKVEKMENKGEKGIAVQRRQKTGCFSAILFAVFVIGISCVIAIVGWMAARDVMSLGKEEISAVVEVDDDDTIDDVAQKLKDNGLIEYPALFKLYAKFANIDVGGKIATGSFDLNTRMDYRALVVAMGDYSDSRMTVTITIPEGYTLSQIVDSLVTNGVAEEDELWDTINNYDFEYSFLEDIPLGQENRLEGYMFPDTYTFYLNENTVTVINKFLSNFNSKVTDEMRAKATEMGFTLREIITIASMIEKEAASDDERSTIASVIYNRYYSDSFPCLQIDATVLYALGEHKDALTTDDLSIDSPYNTYVTPGLPAGPIASPGLKSIQAALNPLETDYYYYALNKDGTHNFFTNYEDHQAFVNSEEYGG